MEIFCAISAEGIDSYQYVKKGGAVITLFETPSITGTRRYLIVKAEGEGFEPSIRFYPYSDLANRRTRPLCDPSRYLASMI